jgi:hypothetical protein
MPLAAVAPYLLTAAGAIGGSIISGNAARSAANASAAGDAAAIAEQRREYDQTRKDQMPWLTTGGSALGQLARIYGLDYVDSSGNKQTGNGQMATGDFYKSPDYNFRMSEGIKGLDASAAANGYLDSGATRKAAIKYAGNLASGEFNNYANRLAGLAGVGQTAATNDAQAGQHYADSYANLVTNAANTRASSYLAAGQANSNLASTLAGIGSGLIANWPKSSQPGSGWTANWGG